MRQSGLTPEQLQQNPQLARSAMGNWLGSIGQGMQTGDYTGSRLGYQQEMLTKLQNLQAMKQRESLRQAASQTDWRSPESLSRFIASNPEAVGIAKDAAQAVGAATEAGRVVGPKMIGKPERVADEQGNPITVQYFDNGDIRRTPIQLPPDVLIQDDGREVVYIDKLTGKEIDRLPKFATPDAMLNAQVAMSGQENTAQIADADRTQRAIQWQQENERMWKQGDARISQDWAGYNLNKQRLDLERQRFEFDKSKSNTPEPIRKQQGAIYEFYGMLRDYQNLIDKTYDRATTPYSDAAMAIESARTDLIMRKKEMEQLGALQANESELMDKALIDPLTMWGRYAGRSGIMAQLDQAKKSTESRAQMFREQGYKFDLPKWEWEYKPSQGSGKVTGVNSGAPQQAPRNYSTFASDATGHMIGSNDGGATWYDVQTGKKVN
jgi:hypothetical protein